jgi:hypothetical protein
MKVSNIVIKKTPPLKTRWGEPYEESDNLSYILKTAVRMIGMGYEIYLQRLDSKQTDFLSPYKFRLFISNSTWERFSMRRKS